MASLAIAAALGLALLLGFRAHRDRTFPYELITLLLGDGPSQLEYTWVRSPSRPPESLNALGYINSAFDPEHEDIGVLTNAHEATWPGWNLFNSEGRSRVQLLNMDGDLGYSWDIPFPVAHVELLDDGGLLTLDKDRSVNRFDAAAELRWSTDRPAHHAPWIHDGRVYALTRYARSEPRIHPSIAVLDERVTSIDLDSGAVEFELSILDALLESEYAFLLPSAIDREVNPEDGPLDVLHPNQVAVMDGRFADRDPLYSRGNLLISMRNLNLLVVVDPESKAIVWAWGPSNLMFQHHPTVLDDGSLLIFDNRMVTSRILTLDPVDRAITWTWSAESFFSPTRGSAQRLPNGNTLITESDRGRVFEIDPDGNEIWRFANPDVDPAGYRSVIWRMQRIGDDHPGIQALRAFRDLGKVTGQAPE